MSKITMTDEEISLLAEKHDVEAKDIRLALESAWFQEVIEQKAAPQERIWLNAFGCVRPTDEFARDLGRSIIETLVASPQPEPDEFGIRGWRKRTFEIGAS